MPLAAPRYGLKGAKKQSVKKRSFKKPNGPARIVPALGAHPSRLNLHTCLRRGRPLPGAPRSRAPRVWPPGPPFFSFAVSARRKRKLGWPGRALLQSNLKLHGGQRILQRNTGAARPWGGRRRRESASARTYSSASARLINWGPGPPRAGAEPGRGSRKLPAQRPLELG